MRKTQYDQAFMFAYSEREKTHAARHLEDDVPAEVKSRRLQEIIAVFREGQLKQFQSEVGRTHLVSCAHAWSDSLKGKGGPSMHPSSSQCMQLLTVSAPTCTCIVGYQRTRAAVVIVITWRVCHMWYIQSDRFGRYAANWKCKSISASPCMCCSEDFTHHPMTLNFYPQTLVMQARGFRNHIHDLLVSPDVDFYKVLVLSRCLWRVSPRSQMCN